CDCMGGLTFPKTYASNVFPFIKKGKKNSSIPRADMLYAAETYALPQIEIVRPRMVICLGRPAFDAVGRAAKKLGNIEWQEAIAPRPHIIIFGAEIYGVPALEDAIYTSRSSHKPKQRALEQS